MITTEQLQELNVQSIGSLEYHKLSFMPLLIVEGSITKKEIF